jgi:hypothetical protein
MGVALRREDLWARQGAQLQACMLRERGRGVCVGGGAVSLCLLLTVLSYQAVGQVPEMSPPAAVLGSVPPSNSAFNRSSGGPGAAGEISKEHHWQGSITWLPVMATCMCMYTKDQGSWDDSMCSITSA